MIPDLEPAVDALRDLLRRRSHPTTAPGIYDAIGALDQLATGLGALAMRLGDELNRISVDPTLRVDGLGDPADPGDLAHAAAEALWHAAYVLGEDGAIYVRDAHSAVSRLYHDPDDDAFERAVCHCGHPECGAC